MDRYLSTRQKAINYLEEKRLALMDISKGITRRGHLHYDYEKGWTFLVTTDSIFYDIKGFALHMSLSNKELSELDYFENVMWLDAIGFNEYIEGIDDEYRNILIDYLDFDKHFKKDGCDFTLISVDPNSTVESGNWVEYSDLIDKIDSTINELKQH